MSSMPKRKCIAAFLFFCVISDEKVAVKFTVKTQEGTLQKTAQKFKMLTFLFVIYR